MDWDFFDASELGADAGSELSSLLLTFGLPSPEFPPGSSWRRKRPILDVRGLAFDQARSPLVLAGFRVHVERLEPDPRPEMGMVVGQSPPAGRKERRGATVSLLVWHRPRVDPGATEATRQET